MRFLRDIKARENAPLPETELLATYRQTGDTGLLGKLYAPYMDMIFAICYKYLRDEAKSKDAVMQIFERLITDLRTHEVTNFKSWLHTVARNYCLMQMRKTQVFVAQEMADETSYEAEDFELNPQDTSFEILGKCMDTLVREQRRSVELFYLQEKCYREIAAETGFEIGKVKSYIQNGKRNLKICMEKNGSF